MAKYVLSWDDKRFSIKYTSSLLMGGCPDKLTSILYHCDSLSHG